MIRQIGPGDLQRLLGEGVRLYDVRTAEENAYARIEGARLVDGQVVGEIQALDRETPLAFHCHHGMRSQAAAEHFERLGFTTLYNLAGGIDAWSLEVDPSVPRY